MSNTSKESFAYYRHWMTEFLRADIKLPKDCSKHMLWSYCAAMAEGGTNGLGCYKSDPVVAREIGISHKDTVAKYRHLAIELGWFVRTGKHKGRTEVLDISIPGIQPDAYHESAELVSDKSVSESKLLAETPPVVDPWETNGVTKVVPKPVPGPGVLWGEAAKAAEKASAVPVDDSEAPKNHIGEWSTDCPRCDWYLLRNHPKHAQVCEEHMDSR